MFVSEHTNSWAKMGSLFRLWLLKSCERQLRLLPNEYEANYSEVRLTK